MSIPRISSGPTHHLGHHALQQLRKQARRRHQKMIALCVVVQDTIHWTRILLSRLNHQVAHLCAKILLHTTWLTCPFVAVSFRSIISWPRFYLLVMFPTVQVKLVGSTISCEPVHIHADPRGKLRHNAHVQSYLVATDAVSSLLGREQTLNSLTDY